MTSPPAHPWQVIVRCACCGLRVPATVEPAPDADAVPAAREPSGRVPRGESAIARVALLVWVRARCPRCNPARKTAASGQVE